MKRRNQNVRSCSESRILVEIPAVKKERRKKDNHYHQASWTWWIWFTGYHEMPKKACERCIFHVIAFFPFSESGRKSGAFQKISTWQIFEPKRNRKWISSILEHFKKLEKCYHVKNTSFTCFLGHLMVSPVYKNEDQRNIRWKNLHHRRSWG